ncbi:MAG: hypothetical protein AAB225_04820 [Acidobacteriota bacterium]
MSFDRLRAEIPAALDLLSLLAFFAPDDIEREMIVSGREKLPAALAQAVSSPVSLDDAVAALRRYSLIDVRENTFAVHRLVQAVTRDRLAEGEADKQWAEAALRVVNGAFPFRLNEVETWGRSSRLLPHALAAAGAEDR